MKWAVRVGLAVLLAPTAWAGTFHLSDGPYEEYIVVHPFGYDGTGGAIDVRICVRPDSGIVKPALEKAVTRWNQLIGSTQNCENCRAIEQGPSDSEEPFDMPAVLLHELGHCALGLGHPNWIDRELGFGPTSYTATVDVQLWFDGPDPFRGTRDEEPAPLPGADLIHWYRKADNNPVVVDSTVIDKSTYSRRIVDLPSGHLWPANGNVAVATLLGELDTQVVMYSQIGRDQRYLELSADEVATVQYGMTGIDETVGTADDYTVSLTVVDDCANADIEVFYESFVGENTLGECTVDLEFIPPGGLFEIHHALTPFKTDPRATIQITPDVPWDVVFADGFESGGSLSWSSTVP